jgi:hypothetical protein
LSDFEKRKEYFIAIIKVNYINSHSTHVGLLDKYAEDKKKYLRTMNVKAQGIKLNKNNTDEFYFFKEELFKSYKYLHIILMILLQLLGLDFLFMLYVMKGSLTI